MTASAAALFTHGFAYPDKAKQLLRHSDTLAKNIQFGTAVTFDDAPHLQEFCFRDRVVQHFLKRTLTRGKSSAGSRGYPNTRLSTDVDIGYADIERPCLGRSSHGWQ